MICRQISILAALALLALVGSTSITQADQVAAQQAVMVQRLQARLPARVDEHTTLVSVYAVGKIAKYSFKMRISKHKVPRQWYGLQQAKLIKDACDILHIRKLMKDGAIYQYLYTDINNRFIVEFRVRDTDCPR